MTDLDHSVSPPSRLLIIEDDADLGGMLSDFFRLKGYRVAWASSSHRAETLLSPSAGKGFDLILLDLNLPDGDGLDLLRSLRRRSSAPVFIVTGRLDRDSRLEGLDEGADDYLIKPFDLRELELRIRNLLRRRFPSPPSQAALVCGDWRVDVERLRITHADGTHRTLTRAECGLLQALLGAEGRLVMRNQIVRQLSAQGVLVSDTSLPVLVSRLRVKLGADERHPVIVAVPGAGYRVEPPGLSS